MPCSAGRALNLTSRTNPRRGRLLGGSAWRGNLPWQWRGLPVVLACKVRQNWWGGDALQQSAAGGAFWPCTWMAFFRSDRHRALVGYGSPKPPGAGLPGAGQTRAAPDNTAVRHGLKDCRCRERPLRSTWGERGRVLAGPPGDGRPISVSEAQPRWPLMQRAVCLTRATSAT